MPQRRPVSCLGIPLLTHTGKSFQPLWKCSFSLSKCVSFLRSFRYMFSWASFLRLKRKRKSATSFKSITSNLKHALFACITSFPSHYFPSVHHAGGDDQHTCPWVSLLSRLLLSNEPVHSPSAFNVYFFLKFFFLTYLLFFCFSLFTSLPLIELSLILKFSAPFLSVWGIRINFLNSDFFLKSRKL